MADTERENDIGFTDKRRLQTTADTGLTTPANLLSVTALRARLTTLNATLYTTAMLNTMTKNDMVYAVRLADETAGI
jgi:hypothetical protein